MIASFDGLGGAFAPEQVFALQAVAVRRQLPAPFVRQAEAPGIAVMGGVEGLDMVALRALRRHALRSADDDGADPVEKPARGQAVEPHDL